MHTPSFRFCSILRTRDIFFFFVKSEGVRVRVCGGRTFYNIVRHIFTCCVKNLEKGGGDILKFSLFKTTRAFFKFFKNGTLSVAGTFLSKSNELTQQIIAHIFKQGGFAWRANSVGIFDTVRRIHRTAPKKGVSDVIGVFRGRFLAIEVKIGKDRLSDEQEGFLASVIHAGGVSFVAKTLEGFLASWQENFPK